MPAQIDASELAQHIANAMAAVAASKPSGILGKVMAVLKPQLAGRGNLAQVSAKVKAPGLAHVKRAWH
jgi:uncharacterized protein YqeY